MHRRQRRYSIAKQQRFCTYIKPSVNVCAVGQARKAADLYQKVRSLALLIREAVPGLFDLTGAASRRNRRLTGCTVAEGAGASPVRLATSLLAAG